MKISEKEFEKLIQDVIDEKITRTYISKEYKIGMRTINKKITNLEQTNINLYKAFIEKFPFQEKEKKEITAEMLLVNIVSGKTIDQVHEEYNISVRTITRRIKSNKRIDYLYKAFRNNELTPEEYKEIESLKVGYKPIKNQARKEFLERIIGEYKNAQENSKSKASAARKIGKTYTDMHKLEEEYKRIKTEENYI